MRSLCSSGPQRSPILSELGQSFKTLSFLSVKSLSALLLTSAQLLLPSLSSMPSLVVLTVGYLLQCFVVVVGGGGAVFPPEATG